MKKIKLILIFLFMAVLLSLNVFAQEENNTQAELYSEEYFDYLIECTKPVVTIKSKKDKKNDEEINEDEIINAFEKSDEIKEVLEPFKLKIESNDVGKYTQSYIKEDTKTIIPITSKMSVTQDVLKFKNNKYVTDDVRMLMGVEYSLNKYFKLTSGLETTYRGQEQDVGSSKKIYFTPTFEFNDKLSLKFHNKYYMQSKATDHDIGLNFSPFKSKALDLGVYAGLTHEANGAFSESLMFKTNFSFF